MELSVKSLGPTYRIVCRDTVAAPPPDPRRPPSSAERTAEEAGAGVGGAGRVLAVTSGFLVPPPLGLMHCDMLQVWPACVRSRTQSACQWHTLHRSAAACPRCHHLPSALHATGAGAAQHVYRCAAQHSSRTGVQCSKAQHSTAQRSGRTRPAQRRLLTATTALCLPPPAPQVFTKNQRGDEGARTRGGVLGLGLLMGAATFAFGVAAGCTKAEILAINGEGAVGGGSRQPRAFLKVAEVAAADHQRRGGWGWWQQGWTSPQAEVRRERRKSGPRGAAAVPRQSVHGRRCRSTARSSRPHACPPSSPPTASPADDEAWHERLVGYYSRFGFVPVRTVRGDSLADLPHMLVWGGAGTRMDADLRGMLRRWSPTVQNR